MRFALCVALGLVGTQAEAITIITKTVAPNFGVVDLYGYAPAYAFGPDLKGDRAQVQLTIRSGSLIAGEATVHWQGVSRYRVAEYPDRIFENDQTGSETCTFGSSVGIGCFAFTGSGQHPAFFASDLSITQRTVNFFTTVPKPFDNCDQPIFRDDCGLRYYFGMDYSFQAASNKPITYQLLIGEPKYVDLSVPEPATWGMMIAGFGLVGGAMRRTSILKPLRHS